MYDAIIVGAGPAGTSAALYAHKLGLKCILLDKALFPRDKICGDALSGKTVRILRELELLDGIENLEGSDINRITFGGPSHNKFDVHLNGDGDDYRHRTKGYVIPRLIFDNFLFENASRVTDTRQGFTVTDLIYENDVLSGVKGVSKEGKQENFFAPIILGCDGPNSIVARKLGLYKMDMDNTAVAIRCYYEGIEGLTDQIELHYVSEAKPGYFWLFPAGEGKANIGIGLSKNDAKKEDRTLKQIMDEIIESKYFPHSNNDDSLWTKQPNYPILLEDFMEDCIKCGGGILFPDEKSKNELLCVFRFIVSLPYTTKEILFKGVGSPLDEVPINIKPYINKLKKEWSEKLPYRPMEWRKWKPIVLSN